MFRKKISVIAIIAISILVFVSCEKPLGLGYPRKT